jgi:tRNA-Thr(GGU) m(6)t(6)A37 methyltransferase TsaA
MLEWAAQAGIVSLMIKVAYDLCNPQPAVEPASKPDVNDVNDGCPSVAELTQALDRMSKLRQEERQGRIRAEKQLKLAKQPQFTQPHTTSDAGYWMDVVAVVESPFHDRRGTPRQPQLAPSIPGFIRFHSKFQPQDSLKGLGEYSHLWVTFVFHGNTNMHRTPSPAVMSCKAMVQPPALHGQKVGCFACRSPHRPNAIGLSLVKLVAVQSDGIVIEAHDLLNGTPVLDVKPYLPHVEAIADARLPSWVQQPERLSLQPAVWLPVAVATLAALRPDHQDDIKQQLSELLAFDIRSPKQRESSCETVYELHYDNLCMQYRMEAAHAVVISIVARIDQP